MTAQLREGTANRKDSAQPLDMEYDPVLGFPARINVESSQQIADDEIFVEATGCPAAQTSGSR